MTTLKEKFPVIKDIKKKMKKNDEIKIDQIKGYNRRVENSPILEFHVEMIQSLTRERDRWKSKFKDLDKEIKRLESCDRGYFENYKSLQKENEKLKLEIELLKNGKV